MSEYKEIDERFIKLIQNLDNDIFWTYVRSWKDEQDIIDTMLEWDIDTKEQAIDEIEDLQKNKIIIDFSDEDDVYARIETKEENFEKIKNYLNEFRNKNSEMYNIDDFLSFLTEREVNFQTIKIEADKKLHF